MALLLAHLIGREGRAKALRSSRLNGLTPRRDDEASVVACTRRACGWLDGMKSKNSSRS